MVYVSETVLALRLRHPLIALLTWPVEGMPFREPAAAHLRTLGQNL
jgi:hypothetical protein